MVASPSESSGDGDESESGVTESEQPSDEPKPSDRPKAETRPEAVSWLHQSIHVLRAATLDAFGEHADLIEQVKIAKTSNGCRASSTRPSLISTQHFVLETIGSQDCCLMKPTTMTTMMMMNRQEATSSHRGTRHLGRQKDPCDDASIEQPA